MSHESCPMIEYSIEIYSTAKETRKTGYFKTEEKFKKNMLHVKLTTCIYYQLVYM